jgi:hypothetical protein
MTYPRKYATATGAGDHLKDLDWDAMVDRVNGVTISGVTVQYPYSYFIRINGGVYEAIDPYGNLDYGGASDAGGVDGAVCSSVIQACITALAASGGLIKFDIGTYPIVAALNVGWGITLVGTNLGTYTGTVTGTILKLAGDVNLIEQIGVAGTEKYGLNIRDMYLDGDARSFTGDAIHVEHVGFLKVENVHIIDFYGSGLFLDSVWDGMYNNIMINRCGNDVNQHAQIHMIGSDGNACQNNDFSKITSSEWRYINLFHGYCSITTLNAFECEGDEDFACVYATSGGNTLLINNFYLQNSVASQTTLVRIDVGAQRIKFNTGTLKAKDGTLVYIEGAGNYEATDLNEFNQVSFTGYSALAKVDKALDVNIDFVYGSSTFVDNCDFDNVVTCITLANDYAGEPTVLLANNLYFNPYPAGVDPKHVDTKFVLTGTTYVGTTSDYYHASGLETDAEGLILVCTPNNHYATGVANRGFFQSVFCPTIMTVDKIRIWVHTQNGNIDVGIYDNEGTKIVSTGAFACPAAGFHLITIAKTVLLPGPKYLAISSDSATTEFYSPTNLTAGAFNTGYAATSHPLPATRPALSETGTCRFWMQAV